MKRSTGISIDLKALRQRWKTNEPFSSIANDYADEFTGIRDRNLDLLRRSCPKTETGMLDLRGFDFSLASGEGPTFLDPRLVKETLENIDFSGAEFVSFSLRDCTVKNCIFQRASFWTTKPRHNSFYKCDFSGSIQRDSILGSSSVFSECCFDHMRSSGTAFNFGSKVSFLDCSFQHVELRNMGHERGVQFNNCKFSGSIVNAVFVSREYWHRASHTKSLIYKLWHSVSPGMKSAFYNCDFSEAILLNVSIEGDVRVQNTRWPEGGVKQPDGSTLYNNNAL